MSTSGMLLYNPLPDSFALRCGSPVASLCRLVRVLGQPIHLAAGVSALNEQTLLHQVIEVADGVAA